MPTPTGTIVLVTPTPQLGQPCVFNVTTIGLHGSNDPLVELVAFQADVMVYAEVHRFDANGTTATFKLGGDSSAWQQNGGPAHCVALLYYWKWHGVLEKISLAAPIEFDAVGV